MTNRKIDMHEYKTIIYQLQQGQSIRAISKQCLAGRGKIQEIKKMALEKGWLIPEAKLPDEKTLSTFFGGHSPQQSQSLAHTYAEEIKKWAGNDVQASTIHQHLVVTYGFKGAYNCIQRFVQKIKAQQPPELTVPLDFKVGEAAQVDFGKGPKLFDERINKEVDTWFFVMTLCWSRHQYVELVTHQDIETWLNCHKNAFEWFNGVVKRVIIDNPKCAVTKACYHNPAVQRSYHEFAEGYGFIISACPPREPKKKGRVESGVKYVKRNFLPLKTFRSLQEANKELKIWVTGTAGNRIHGSTFKKPLTQFTEIEQSQLKPLPMTPPEIALWKNVSLYKDCHVRHLKCKYSAPHTLYNKALWLKATPSTITIYHEHEIVAQHARLFEPGIFSTKKEHMPPNARFYLEKDSGWCLERSTKIGESCLAIIEDMLTDPVRDLLRQAQSILTLDKTYGEARLEKACKRARAFNACNYKTIKTILKEGLDYERITPQESFEQLSSVYQGKALFQRDINELVH
jgi:transposase